MNILYYSIVMWMAAGVVGLILFSLITAILGSISKSFCDSFDLYKEDYKRQVLGALENKIPFACPERLLPYIAISSALLCGPIAVAISLYDVFLIWKHSLGK